jgi:hypothetical protein
MTEERKRSRKGRVCVLAGARYWWVTPAQHFELLRAYLSSGERPGTDLLVGKLDLWPEPAHCLAYGIKARISWEDGGVRNLDGVSLETARAYLANHE